MPIAPVCHAAHLGILEYQQAWDFQLRIAQEIRDGQRPNTLLLLEHPPVYTKGRLSKTEHVAIVHEATLTCGFGAEVAAQIADAGVGHLDGPVRRIAYPDSPSPFKRALEDAALPSVDRIVNEVRQVLDW